MIASAPTANSTSMSTGTHGGLSLALAAIGGMYRHDASTEAVRAAAFAATRSPGFVPAGVVRPPPVLRFGGAIRPERKGLNGSLTQPPGSSVVRVARSAKRPGTFPRVPRVLVL